MADYLTYVHPRAAGPDAPLWPAPRESGCTSRATGVGTADGARIVRACGAGHVLPVFTRSRGRCRRLGAAGDDTGSRRQAIVSRRADATAPPRRGLQAGLLMCRIALARPRATDDHAGRHNGDWVPETVENPLPEPVARNVVMSIVAAPRQRLSCMQDRGVHLANKIAPMMLNRINRSTTTAGVRQNLRCQARQ